MPPSEARSYTLIRGLMGDSRGSLSWGLAVKVTDIEIYAGRPDFEYEPVRRIEAKCEAAHAFSSAPSMEEVNVRLRALAAKVGANAIVEVDYDSGVSLTSWRALKGTGLAVRRVSDERQCPSCAETIKKAALKCRFCGRDLGGEIAAEMAVASPQAAGSPFELSQEPPIGRPSYQKLVRPAGVSKEPLRSTDAMPIWVWIVAGVVAVGAFASIMGSM